jgi:glycerol-3-phosphate dehydrogenase
LDHIEYYANFSTGVKFLESMGLPKSKLTATRKEVESGKLSFKDLVEYKLYSRHDAPDDEMASDAQASPVMKKGSPANK